MNNEIEELKNRIAALERQLQGQNAPATTKVEEPWPQHGDEYWFLDSDGDSLNSDFEVGNVADRKRLAMGNVFRTEEEAEKRAKHIKALVKLRSLVPDGYKLDWRLPDRKHYYTLYDCLTGEWIPSFCYAAIMPNQIYFPTAEATEHAIKAMGDQINDLLEGGYSYD